MDILHSTKSVGPAEQPETHTADRNPRLVLASASPRRHDLLSLLGVPFRIIATDAEDQDHPPSEEICAALPPSTT